jgi:hypothetical protein
MPAQVTHVITSLAAATISLNIQTKYNRVVGGCIGSQCDGRLKARVWVLCLAVGPSRALSQHPMVWTPSSPMTVLHRTNLAIVDNFTKQY